MNQMKVEHLPVLVLRLDWEDTIVYANEMAMSLTGLQEDLIGKNFYQVFGSPEIGASQKGYLFESLTQEATTYQSHYKARSGEVKWIAWQTYPSSEFGNYRICIGFDVTMTKRSIDKIIESRDEANKANKAKSEFIANISHELRTPLNAIIGYSEMIVEEVDEMDTESIKQDSSKINAAGKHLLDLLNSVLDLAKIEAGRMELQNDRFKVKEFVSEIIATVQTLSRERDNELVLTCPDEIIEMFADRIKLKEIVLNLLSNACKFTEKGTISLIVSANEDRVHFEVKDTGAGISEEDLSSLFNAYMQVGESRKGKIKGTGLGLMLSKKMAELMHGTLTVRSVLGEGSSFHLSLPLTYVERVVTPTMAPSVVMIDDDLSAQEISRRFLSKQGYELHSAYTGEEGLRMVREMKPTAIILDLILPDIDGWQVFQELKQGPETRDIPVIVMTVEACEQQNHSSYEVEDFLVKPVPSTFLIDVLNKHKRGDKPALLVVEDDERVRALLIRIAGKEGWYCEQAANGREALEQINKQKPDLIFLDLNMPVMDGYEFLEKFQEKKEWHQIPVVILTGENLTKEEKDFLNRYVGSIVRKGEGDLERLQAVLSAKVKEGTKEDV